MSDVDQPQSLETRARELMKRSPAGSLATVDDGGHPYASMVEVVGDEEGALWMLISDLAVHTQNLKGDERASLLLDDSRGAGEERLNELRATYVGRARSVEDPPQEVVEAYLEVHPQAKQWVGFKDFGWVRLEVERVRVVAGFGQIGWVDWQR